MKNRSFAPLVCMLGVAALLAAFAVTGTMKPAMGEGDAPAVKPVASIKSIMHANNAYEEEGTDSLFKMVDAFVASKPGKDQKNAWTLARHRALMIAEGGNLLLAQTPIRGEAKSWKEHSAAFRDEAKKLSKAIAMRNVDKAAAAIATVKKRCTACHDAHRPQ